MLTSLFSSMSTTLLRLWLPLNHKHNIVPPKLPAQCQTDSLNPLHPNHIHRTQCLTPEPRTQSPTRYQNPSLLHPNSPLGVRQIRSIFYHPNLIRRPQCLTPEPNTQSQTQTPEPKTPYQSLNYSRPAHKTNNPPTCAGGLPGKPKLRN